MTVAELEARMTPRELFQWDEWLILKAANTPDPPAPPQRGQ